MCQSVLQKLGISGKENRQKSLPSMGLSGQMAISLCGKIKQGKENLRQVVWWPLRRWHLSEDWKEVRSPVDIWQRVFQVESKSTAKTPKQEHPGLLKREQEVQCHWSGMVEGSKSNGMRLGERAASTEQVELSLEPTQGWKQFTSPLARTGHPSKYTEYWVDCSGRYHLSSGDKLALD